MADLIDLRKLHIQDSSELRKRGLMAGTIKLIEDDIRALGTGSQGEALLAIKGGVIYALIKLFRPDRKNCRAHIEFVFTSDANADTQSGVVDEVLRYCFLDQFYHKVTVICNHGNEGLERITFSQRQGSALSFSSDPDSSINASSYKSHGRTLRFNVRREI